MEICTLCCTGTAGFPSPLHIGPKEGICLALVGDGGATTTITTKRNQINRLPLTVTKLSLVNISPNAYHLQGSEGRLYDVLYRIYSNKLPVTDTPVSSHCGCNFDIFGFFHPCTSGTDGAPIANKGFNCAFESTTLKAIYLLAPIVGFTPGSPDSGVLRRAI